MLFNRMMYSIQYINFIIFSGYDDRELYEHLYRAPEPADRREF